MIAPDIDLPLTSDYSDIFDSYSKLLEGVEADDGFAQELKDLIASFPPSLPEVRWRNNIEPPNFDEFCIQLDGQPLFPRQYKAFKEAKWLRAADLFSPYRDVLLLVLLFGKGSGKDYMIGKFFAWVCFCLLHLEGDPAAQFGLAPRSEICIINCAPDGETAKKTFFRYIKGFVKRPMFKPFMRNPKAQILTAEIYFELEDEYGELYRSIAIYSLNSRAVAMEGRNPIGFVMDEADAFLSTDERDNAEEIYNTFEASCESRFPNRWFGAIITWPRVEGGFAERMFAIAKSRPDMFYCDRAATWDVNPRIKETSRVIQAAFERDPRLASAMYKCLPMAALMAFIEFPERIGLAVNINGRLPCADWHTEDVEVVLQNGAVSYNITAVIDAIRREPGRTYTLGVDGGHTGDAYVLAIMSYMARTSAFEWLCPDHGKDEILQSLGTYVEHTHRKNCFAPEELIEKPFEYHVRDVYCGVCGHVPGDFFMSAPLINWWRLLAKEGLKLMIDGQEFVIPYFQEELLIRIPGNQGKPIDFPHMRRAEKYLIQNLSIRNAMFDPWQQISDIQTLRAETGCDIQLAKMQNPEQKRRAILQRRLLYAGLYDLLPSEIRDKEWRQVKLVKGEKIDHPANGSKDVWDAEGFAGYTAAITAVPALQAILV